MGPIVRPYSGRSEGVVMGVSGVGPVENQGA